MPITLTCPSCGGQCAVKEDYAGMQVRCPRCPGVITVPMLAPGAPGVPVIESAPVDTAPPAPGMPPAPGAPAAPGAPPPLPMSQAGPLFLEKVTKFLAANGVAGVNKILLFVGLGCMAFFLITVLFPWFGVSFTGLGSHFILGITQLVGVLDFLLVLAVLFLVVFSVMMEWTKVFDYALWTASNLAAFIALHLLALPSPAWGLYVSFLVMAGAAGTLGVVAFTKVFSSKT